SHPFRGAAQPLVERLPTPAGGNRHPREGEVMLGFRAQRVEEERIHRAVRIIVITHRPPQAQVLSQRPKSGGPRARAPVCSVITLECMSPSRMLTNVTVGFTSCAGGDPPKVYPGPTLLKPARRPWVR